MLLGFRKSVLQCLSKNEAALVGTAVTDFVTLADECVKPDGSFQWRRDAKKIRALWGR